jgi:hypothetical protein
MRGFVAGTTTALARGGRVAVQQIATDAFGNALGESIAGALLPAPDTWQDPYGNGRGSSTYMHGVQASGLPVSDGLATQYGTSAGGPTDGSGASPGSWGFARDHAARQAALTASFFNGGDGGGDATPSGPRTVTVQAGDGLERIARAQYGDDWRAGIALMVGANNITKTDPYGNPIIHPNDNLVAPSIAGAAGDVIGRLNRAGGQIVADNTAARMRMQSLEMLQAVVAATPPRATGIAYQSQEMTTGDFSGANEIHSLVNGNGGATGEPLGPGFARLAGGVVGVAKTGWDAANGMVRIAGNTVLQIGDILTLGMNHDSDLMQQVWQEQHALGAGMVRLATEPMEVISGAVQHVEVNYALSEALRAQGREFDAAVINSNQTSEIVSVALGGAQAVRGIARYGASSLSGWGVPDTVLGGRGNAIGGIGNVEVPPQGFKSLDELNALRGTGSTVGDLSEVSGISVQDIVKNIPQNSSVRKLTPAAGGSQVGLEYKWVDENGVTNRLRMHDPDPSAGAGSNSADGWTARWQVGKGYYDPIEDAVRHPNVHNSESPFYDSAAANSTHIPIQTPESWLADLMRFTFP